LSTATTIGSHCSTRRLNAGLELKVFNEKVESGTDVGIKDAEDESENADNYSDNYPQTVSNDNPD